MNDSTKRFTADEAKTKASECREMAKRVLNAEHRAILERMADAWDSIGQSVAHRADAQ